MSGPLISIIIRSKNEERWIGYCLREVYNQSYTNIEVIIVDNNSTDSTLVKAKQFPVIVVNIDKYFPGKAINTGINASNGQVIVFLSGHCIPASTRWLENLISNFKEFVNAVKKSKPDSIKGKFINKIYLSTSMGPSMRIENIK